MGKIILGSASPRRADILKKLDIEFEIIPSSYVEPHDQTDFSYAFVENSAYNKALYVAKEHRNEDCKTDVTTSFRENAFCCNVSCCC